MVNAGKTPKSTAKKKVTGAKRAAAPAAAKSKKVPPSRSLAKSPRKGEPKGSVKTTAKVSHKGQPKAPVKSPFSKSEVEHFRSMLVARRDRILRQVTSMEREALKSGGQDYSVDHMADNGSDTYEQDFTLSLVEGERRELYDINSALVRIQEGTYGICEGTGEVIGRPRLEAIPYTRYSIEYQRKVEAGEIDEDEGEEEEEEEEKAEEEEEQEEEAEEEAEEEEE